MIELEKVQDMPTVPDTKYPIYVIPESEALVLEENIQQLGKYVIEVGLMLKSLRDQVDEMKARQKTATISHRETLDLAAMIRIRTDALCGKYQLTDPSDARAIRAAIKKEILIREGIKDLHDLPEVALPGVRKAVDRWVNIRLIMKRRELHQETGP